MTTHIMKQVREFWDAQPCNSWHPELRVGDAKYFAELANRRYTVEPHIERFAQFNYWDNQEVLELGCGIGTDAVRFAKSGARVMAVDMSETSLALARANAACAKLNYSRIRFIVANLEQLNLADKRPWALIYAFGVLHHTPNPRVALDRIVEHMAPHTELRMMVYARHSWKSAMIDAGLDQFEAASGCPVAYRYTEEQIKTLCASAGLEVIDFEQCHIFRYSIPEYKEGRLVELPWFTAMPVPVFRALERALGWHLLIRARKQT